MLTKELSLYSLGISLDTRVGSGKKKNKLLYRIVCFAIALLTIPLAMMTSFNKAANSEHRHALVADFRFDMNMLNEAANIIEARRILSDSKEVKSFGADGRLVATGELEPNLLAALAGFTGTNKDGKLSGEEISKLEIMGLDSETYQKELSEMNFNFTSMDRNLKHYVVITKGDHSGTVLYNGKLKIIDSENKRYFSADLSY